MSTENSASCEENEFALDHIVHYERKFDEFGTPLLKRKSLEPTDSRESRSGGRHNGEGGSARKTDASTIVTTSMSESFRSESTSKTTVRTSTNGNAMRSPLSTFKLMSQTIAEYGDMIAQRRTEIAELQRANQLRLSNSAYPKSASSIGSEAKARAAETRAVSMSEAVSLANVMAGEESPELSPESGDEYGETSARKLDFASAPHVVALDSTQTPQDQGIDDATGVGVNSAAAWSRLSVRDELLTQLNGEKLRVTELTAKINEMYRLEEEQRLKARNLAELNDQLQSVRDNLEEQLRATQLLVGDLEKQGELKDTRVKDLELQLSSWMSKYDIAMQELYQCRADVASLMDEDSEHVSQRDSALAKLEQYLASNLKLKNELDVSENERKGLVKQRQLLLHQRDETVGKIATLEASVSSFRSELHIATDKCTQLEILLRSKQDDVDNLTTLLAEATTRADALSVDLETLYQGNNAAATTAEEALLDAEARKHLQLKVSTLENALLTVNSEHEEYRVHATKELEAVRLLYQTQLDECKETSEKLENKLTDYKNRLKMLQKTQKNGNSELIAENESLRSLIGDRDLKVDAMQNQLTLGEQSWVQQAAILKASLQEANDKNAELLQELEKAEADKTKHKKLADPVVSVSRPENTVEQSQIRVLENTIKSLSVRRKWQNTIILITILVSLLAIMSSYAIKFRPCTHDDFRITS